MSFRRHLELFTVLTSVGAFLCPFSQAESSTVEVTGDESEPVYDVSSGETIIDPSAELTITGKAFGVTLDDIENRGTLILNVTPPGRQEVDGGMPGFDITNLDMLDGSTLAFDDSRIDDGNIKVSGSVLFDSENYGYIYSEISNGSTSGNITKTGSGSLTLYGKDSYTGTTEVAGGELQIDGDSSGATGQVSVESSAALGGTGTIGGSVDIAGGATLAAGDAGQVGTLTIDGGLTLESGSTTEFDLGQAGTEGGAQNDLIKVGGDLTLGGTIDVTADPASGTTLSEGVYRLFDYAGTLSVSTALSSTLPINAGDKASIQTVIPGKVNLVVYGTQTNIWNGSATQDPAGNLTAGSGTWNISNNNWTDLGVQVDHAWNAGEEAIFKGTSGTVTVDDSSGQVTVGSMDFENTDGNTYTITGGALQASGSTLAVNVGSSGKAEIDSVIQDASGQSTDLVKTGDGTLTLAGVNTYTGKTEVQEGVLAVYMGNDALYNSSNVDIDKSGTLSLLYQDPDLEFDVKSLDGSGAITTNASNNNVVVALEDASGTYSGNASTSIDVASGAETFGGGTVNGLESSSNANIVISANGEQDIAHNMTFFIEGCLELDGTLNIEGTGNVSDVIVDGEVKGSGGLNISAASGAEFFLILNGERSYTGLTTIGSDSALMLEDDNSQMTGNMSSSKIIDNGLLFFVSAPNINDVQTLSAPISGDGTIVVSSDRLIIRALLEIRYDRFSRGSECDSKAGCGRQHNEAAWPELHARRNAIRLI